MPHIPISRWGEPYKSLDIDKVVHFATGEVLAEVSRANGGAMPAAPVRSYVRFPSSSFWRW